MKLITRTLSILSLGGGMILSSCANEAPWSSGDKPDGKINLHLEADGDVKQGTRADDVSALVPNIMEFSIGLKSTDGSYNETWKTLEAFNKEEGFPMGSYHISATFGDLETEGFTSPYFYGESSVSVIKGEESPVSITATLANAMLSIRYSEDFGKFFRGYSAISTTDGHDPLVFVQNEGRPAYITPGEVNIKLTLTNEANQTVTVSPASFNAEPRKHYIVTFGVDGNIDREGAFLTIEWSEEVISEERTITLSEELFSSPAPSLTLEGYEKAPDSMFEGVEYEGVNPEFHVIAFGGLTKATLKIQTVDGILPACGSEVELLNADETSQATLEASGIDCAGFFKNVSEMGVVNLKEMLKRLSPGSYTVTLNIEDSYGRTPETAEPVEMKVKITGLEYKFLTYTKPDFMSEEIVVVVEANTELVKDQLMFRAWDTNGNFRDVEAQLMEVALPQGVNSTLGNAYTYKLSTEPISNWAWKVQTLMPNKKAHELDIDVNMPQFTIETDAFARKVRFRVKDEDNANVKEWILKSGKIYKGDQEITSSVSLDESIGIFEITDGIESDQTYNDYSVGLGWTLYDGYKGNMPFTTEEEQQIPNSNFSETALTVNFTNINVNGKFIVKFIFSDSYQITSDIVRYEPIGWSSLNDLTCYSNSTNQNTWYMVPSTYVENGIVVINSVGYSHNGRALKDTDAGGTFNTTYYCTDTPSETELEKKSGELFLGDYSFDSMGEKPKYGINFESRPLGLSFDYSYQPIGEETGSVEISIIDENGNIISKADKLLNSTANFVTQNLTMEDYAFAKKASIIKLVFRSTSDNQEPQIIIPSGSALNEGVKNIRDKNDLHRDANTYKAFAKGSELRISNVKLEY